MALHGSWNRSEKDGYKVVSLHWDAKGKIEERDFVSGFLKDDTTIGRPAEIAEGPDGAIYISDDYTGVIYRVAYEDTTYKDTDQGQESLLSEMTGSNEPPVTYVTEDTLSEIDGQTRVALAEEGNALFTQHACSACHAEEGEGQIKLKQIGTKYNLDTLAIYLTAPTPPMPIYPLTDHQKRALGVYLLENDQEAVRE